MTRDDNSESAHVRQDKSTGKWYVWNPWTGRRWALRDTVDAAWADFYDDLYRTWPAWAPARKEQADDSSTAVQKPDQAVA